MTVRLATEEDEPEITRLLYLMHKEGGMLSLNVDRARQMFAKAWKREGGIIGVIGDSKDIKAMIYLWMGQYWYTSESHLEEVFNYVRPDHRKSGYAKELIVFAKECQEKLDIPLVIGVLTNQRTQEKVRLYQRVLGIPAGAFFVYGAKWVNLEPTSGAFWSDIFRRKPSKVGESVS